MFRLITLSGTKTALMLQHAVLINLFAYTMLETLKHQYSKTTNLSHAWFAVNFQMIRSSSTALLTMVNLTLRTFSRRNKFCLIKVLVKRRQKTQVLCNVWSRWEDIKTAMCWWSAVRTVESARCILILLLSLSPSIWKRVVLLWDIMMLSDVSNITNRVIWCFHLVLIIHWEFGTLKQPDVWLSSVDTVVSS